MKRLAWMLLAAACGPISFAHAADSSISALVQTTSIARGALPRTVIAYGTVQANAAARAMVMAPVAATVTAVYVRTGQRVAAHAPLIALAPTPQTAASYAAAASAEHVAADALARTKQLAAESLATALQVAAAEKADSDARAALAALRAQGAAGTSTVRAAAAGIVTAVSASRGAIVAEGAPLVELANAGGLVLVAGAVPSEALQIKPGDRASITPIGADRALTGKVIMRGAAVDPASGLVPIEITLPEGAAFPGESASARITTALVAGFVVPHEAVLINDAGQTYVVEDVNGAAKFVTVHVLVSAGERDAVDGALDPAVPVILAGAYQLENGMKVRRTDPSPQAAR